MPLRSPRRASTLPVRFASSPEHDDRHHRERHRPRVRIQIPSRARHSSDEISSQSENDIVDSDGGLDRIAADEYEIRPVIHRHVSREREHSIVSPRTHIRSRPHSRPRWNSSTSSDRTPSASPPPVRRRETVSFVLPPAQSLAGRSSRRSRSRHYEHFYESLSDSSDYFDEDVYKCTVPGRTSSLFSQDSKSPASLNSTRIASVAPSALTHGAISLKPEVTHSVVKSQYNGEGFVGGEHKVNLSVMEQNKKDRSSLFRWVHFHDQSMNFDYFENSVKTLPGPNDAERAAALKLLARARSKFDKIYESSNRTKVRVMQPGVLQEEMAHVPGTKQITHGSQAVTWLCLPYFSLDRYSNDISKMSKGAHPIRTLLQASSTSVDWKRESQQAARSLPGVEPGLCYHVPQVWYLVLGDSYLITCSHLPISSLRGRAISTTIIPTSGTSKADSQRVLIYYGLSVLWSFSVEECQTWFELVVKFSEVWPQQCRLLFRGRVVNPSLWQRIVQNARHTFDNITLQAQIRHVEETSQLKGILRQHGDILSVGEQSDSIAPVVAMENEGNHASDIPMSPSISESFKPISHSTVIDNFFVFAWLSLRDAKRSKSLGINQEQMYQDLQAVDSFLTEQTNLDESLAYQQCVKSTWTAVYSYLRGEADSIAKSAATTQMGDDSRKRALHERRINAFNATESVFEFFLPLSSEGPTIGKFWGALATLLQIAHISGNSDPKTDSKPKLKRLQSVSYEEYDISDFGEEMETLFDTMRPFKEILSQMPLQRRMEITIPDEFFKAWLHLVMALVFAAKHSSEWRMHVQNVSKLIDKGTKTVMLDLTHTDLLADSVVMPQEIVSAISFQLIQDEAKPDNQRDIVHVYTDYFNRLKIEIEANPLDRGHQDKILRLKQEIAVIEQNLETQRRVLTSLGHQGGDKQISQRYLEKDNYSRAGDDQSRVRSRSYSRRYRAYDVGNLRGQSRLTPTDPDGYRELFSQECQELVRRKLESFRDLKENATELERWNIRRIETNKDRQDAAIYIFTIVTVIFLPLSTVAGILGMNTNDIRNMDLNQWIFWAVALPLTFIIIFLCLAWSGELDNFWSGFRFLFRRDRVVQMMPSEFPRARSRSHSHRRPSLYHRRHSDESDAYSSDDIVIERRYSSKVSRP